MNDEFDILIEHFYEDEWDRGQYDQYVEAWFDYTPNGEMCAENLETYLSVYEGD